MLRRRRRRSSFAPARPRARMVTYAAIAVAAVAGFVFFMNQADTLAPEPQEISTPLPDAFAE